MRWIFAAAIAVAFTSQALADSPSLYRAVVHLLNTKGEVETMFIAATSNGVPYAECELRKDAWWRKEGPGFEAAAAAARANGLQAEISVTCEKQ